MTSSNQVPGSTPDHQIGACHVWIKQASSAIAPDGRQSYGFSWSTPWQVCKRLLPQTATRTAGSVGSASFTLVQRTREENGQPILGDPDNVVRGAYVAITLGIPQTYAADGTAVAPTWDQTKAVWYGWITDIAATVSLASPADEVGTVTAQEIGALLDAQQVRGWLGANNPSGGGPQGPLKSPPTANYSIANGVIVGNAVDSGFGYKVFASSPAQCGTSSSNYWSRWELLKHIILLCKPPSITLALLVPSSGIEGFLADTTVPEVFELDGLTFKGALDMLLPRSRGFGWYLTPNDTNIGVNVYSHDPDGSFLNDGHGDLAINAPVTVTGEPAIVSLNRAEAVSDDYDQIVIRGERHVICGTLNNSSFVPGWKGWTVSGTSPGSSDPYDATSAEYQFRTCPNVILPASPKPEDKLARYQEYRTAPGLDRVFSAFRFESDGGLDLYKEDGSAFFPLITWDGANLSLTNQDAYSQCPSLPVARVERSIPWPKGLQPDGTDFRTSQQIAQPEYLAPRLFRYTSTPPPNDAQQWVNLLNPSQSAGTLYVSRNPPEISADDRSCGLLVRFSPGHELLARNHWTDGVDAYSFNAPSTPNSGDAQNPCLDWQWLVFTVAIRSDQRVEVTRTKPGISSGQVRRRLVIEEDGLAFWFVWRDAVLALKQAADGSMQPWYPTITNTDPTASAIDSQGYVVRNGYPLAERFADMVSAWVFRPRVSISVRLAWPDFSRSWLAIGTMIGQFDNQTGVNTVIESITYSLAPGNAGVSFSTTLIERPALPRLPAMAGMTSPAGAGQISVSLGGTVAQAVQRVDQRVTRLESLAQPPVVPAKFAPPDESDLEVVTQNAHGFTVGQYVAWTGTTWLVADSVTYYEHIGRVMQVPDANTFWIATSGWHLVIGNSYTNYTPSWLTTLGASTETEPDAPGGSTKTSKTTKRMVHIAFPNGWIWLPGNTIRRDHNHDLGMMADVALPATPSDKDVLTYSISNGLWSNMPALTALGQGVATSVLGVAGSSAANRADITATADGQVLCRSGGTLSFKAIGGGGLSLTLEQLTDVTITSAAANDFLTWNGTAWVNRNLGPIVTSKATGGDWELGIDGGVSGLAMTTLLGHSGSRLLLANTGNTSIDFKLSGNADTNSDVCARLKTWSGGVQWFDQSTGLADGTSSGAQAGDEVMEWGCFAHASASSRYFRFGIDVQFADATGMVGGMLKVHGQAANQWRILDSSGSTFVDFFTLGTTGNPLVSMLSDMLATKNLFVGAATGAGMAKLAVAANVLSVTVGAGAAVVSVASNQIGFFNVTPVGQQSLNAAITQGITAGSISATYTQSQIQTMCNDIGNCISAINAARTALRALGLCT